MKNQPAFPTTQYMAGTSPFGHSHGMSLRDYFAAQAMQAAFVEGCFAFTTEDYNNLSRISYEMADAMLRARENAVEIPSTSPAEIRRQRNSAWDKEDND